MTYRYYLVIIFCVLMFYSCTKSDVVRNQDNNSNTDSTYHLNIRGLLKTCNNHDLTNGDLVIATNQGYEVMHISNGYVDTTLISYTGSFNDLSAWVIDMDSLTVSDTLSMQVSSDSLDLGIVQSCARHVDEYIACNIGQDKFSYVPILFDTLSAGGFDTLGAPTTYFYRSSMHISNSTFYSMQFAGMSLGTFGVNWNSGFHMGRYYSFNMPAAGTVTYSTYHNVGEYIEGSLDIPFVDNTDSLHYTLTGRFRVKRDY